MSPPARRLLLALLAVPLAAGCMTQEVRTPVGSVAEVRTADPARAWELVSSAAGSEGDTLGMVLFFRARGEREDSLYMVRNVWHQDLGLIDAYGRAYRYLPHHREPAWVGSGTVLQGAERILGVQECGMVEVPFPGAEERPTTPGEHDRRRIQTRTEAPGASSAGAVSEAPSKPQAP
jgi:hypothetical protein